MKLANNVSAEKLRGGYYTAAPVVDFCVQRAMSLFQQNGHEPTWLEPSAGDGAFIEGISRFAPSRPRVVAAELNAGEAEKCARVAARAGVKLDLFRGSFFEWADSDSAEFDLVVGNPPFVRYQFIPKADQQRFSRQLARLGIELRRVSNLWIPFAILSLARVRPGGAFAMVLPSELVATVSGEHFRAFLAREFASVRVDLFARGTFPDILQDVVIVSGRRTQTRRRGERSVEFVEHHPGSEQTWRHRVPESGEAWSRCFLTHEELRAYDAACALPGITQLGTVARMEVSIVTGANAYFTVSDEVLREHGLSPWARPFIARTADCLGLVCGSEDHDAARQAGSRSWLLDFDAKSPVPPSAYIRLGEEQRLHERYKCRIREPWYRVPHIKAGRLMMTKRAHRHHRLLLNDAGVLTTDTVYRGEVTAEVDPRDLVAGFQNTLTLLSTEIEGRTYGGGVLELVPSEIARLRVPSTGMRDLLPQLDTLSREVNGQRDESEAVRVAVDGALSQRLPGYRELLPILATARDRLVARRHR